MHRRLYALGLAYVAVCAALLSWYRRPGAAPPAPSPHVRPVEAVGTPGEWFARIKPFCNPVEVELAERQNPAPPGAEGTAFAAACWALAGKVDRARVLIDALPSDQRARAAGVVFDVAHPVADAGDDQAAGPIMEMVIDYWPNHYMALYHAGMSEYALGQLDRARQNLNQFLRYYQENDGWRQHAIEVLGRIGQ
jgi:tetratricopeptide (TPR) repeat protein